MFFFFCFSVTSDDSCLVSLRRMARVCLDRRSRGRYLRAVRGNACGVGSGLNALLALVEEPQLGALVGVDDGQDLGDTLANIMDAGKLGGRTTGNLGSPELDQLPFACQHRVSPCACARAPTYDLSSASWVARSSLDLFQSWAVFCGGCKYSNERCGRCERACGSTYDLGLRLQRMLAEVHQFEMLRQQICDTPAKDAATAAGPFHYPPLFPQGVCQRSSKKIESVDVPF